MNKEEMISCFVKGVFEKDFDYMEIIHTLLAVRIGWDKYDSLDNKTGTLLTKLIERYLVENGLLTDLGNSYAFSTPQVRKIGELMFSETPTLLDVELMSYC